MAIQVRKTISLSKDNVEWFKRIYGENSLSWGLDGLLEAFRKAHVHTPQEYMTAGAESLKELVEERIR